MTQAFQIGPGQVGDKMYQKVWSSGRYSHGSDTPLVVGSFSINPDLYALAKTSLAFEFVAIAANGTTPLTTHVRLYNVTDAEVVTSSVLNIVDSTDPTKYSAALTLGAGAGEFKTGAEKIYSCEIYLDAPPGGGSDTIELFGAELLANFTLT